MIESVLCKLTSPHNTSTYCVDDLLIEQTSVGNSMYRIYLPNKKKNIKEKNNRDTTHQLTALMTS